MGNRANIFSNYKWNIVFKNCASLYYTPVTDNINYMTFCNPMDYSPPGSSVLGFSRQEYWSQLPFPPPGDVPNPGIEPGLLHCRWILY